MVQYEIWLMESMVGKQVVSAMLAAPWKKLWRALNNKRTERYHLTRMPSGID